MPARLTDLRERCPECGALLAVRYRYSARYRDSTMVKIANVDKDKYCSKTGTEGHFSASRRISDNRPFEGNPGELRWGGFDDLAYCDLDERRIGAIKRASEVRQEVLAQQAVSAIKRASEVRQEVLTQQAVSYFFNLA